MRNCRIEVDGFGIYIRGADGCVVEQNRILSQTDVPPAQRGNGIHLWKTKRDVIAGNEISGKRDAIYLSYAEEVRIANNRVFENRFGIHYMYSHRNDLIGNLLTSNAVGATLMFARDCLIEGNRAVANRRHGLLLKQVERSRILRNTVAGQNRGLVVQQAVQDRFEGNVVARNDVGLYLSTGSEENVFVGNVFISNTDQVWQPQDEVDRGQRSANRFFEKNRGNFWSDYTGADANADGIGDVPYHETDVFGYILDRYPEARVFATSPAAGLLRKGEELLPILDVPGVTDLYPLMRPPGVPSSPGAKRAAAMALIGANFEVLPR